MRKFLIAATTLVALVTGGRLAQAAIITSEASVSGATVIDFSQFAGGGYNFTFGPTQIGGVVGSDVVFTAAPGGGGNSGDGSVLGDGSYGLSENGSWDTGPGGDAYTGLDSDTGHMTYTFNDGPVSAVGGFINYVPDAGYSSAIIEVLAVDGMTVLESYVLNTDAPISTPGGSNAGSFRGISRAVADIGAFRVRNAYIVLDDLRFGSSGVQPVPEPASLAIFGVGALGLFIARRRGRQGKSG